MSEPSTSHANKAKIEQLNRVQMTHFLRLIFFRTKYLFIFSTIFFFYRVNIYFYSFNFYTDLINFVIKKKNQQFCRQSTINFSLEDSQTQSNIQYK